jgi:hypothetical protein
VLIRRRIYNNVSFRRQDSHWFERRWTKVTHTPKTAKWENLTDLVVWPPSTSDSLHTLCSFLLRSR